MAIWQNGRYGAAQQYASPNCEARPAGEPVDLIVLHNISLPPFEYGSDAIARLRTGQVQQFVSCDDMAYHAGISQFHGREKCNRFSIGIELEGCDFEPFTEAQYAALLPLLHDICAAYPIAAITGHQDIAPQRKTDPGHFFDWCRLQRSGLPIDRNTRP